MNFAVALLVTAVVRRLGSTPVLAAGVAATLVGMAWLSRVDPDSSYPTAVALPMVLIGIGQGLAFAPMTSAGLAGTDGRDAGAASGLVNAFHQLGSALGLGILVAVGVAGTPADTSAIATLVERVDTALVGAAVMLAVALVLVVTPHRRPAAVHRLVAPRRTGHRRVTGHGRRRRRQRQRLIAIPDRASASAPFSTGTAR